MSETLRPDPGLLRLERVDYGHPHAMQLIAEVQAEYVIRYGGTDATPLDPQMFAPPLGSFYVGYLPVDAGTEVPALRGSHARSSGEPQRAPKGVERPVATGAWRVHDDLEVFGTRRTAEIKRMYVVPEARAAGLARRILSHLESTAAAGGAEAMILETGTAQPEAIALYTSSGYELIPSFGYYKDEPQNRCFAKLLG